MIRVVTSPLPDVLVVAEAMSAEVRSVVVAALLVLLVVASVEGVEVDGVVEVADELAGVVEATELPLNPEDAVEGVVALLLVELSRVVEESAATVELLLGVVEDEVLLGEELGLLDVDALLKSLLAVEVLGVVAATLAVEDVDAVRLLSV